MFTDDAGNLPELTTISSFVDELAARLQANRDVLAKTGALADLCQDRERAKQVKLGESVSRHKQQRVQQAQRGQLDGGKDPLASSVVLTRQVSGSAAAVRQEIDAEESPGWRADSSDSDNADTGDTVENVRQQSIDLFTKDGDTPREYPDVDPPTTASENLALRIELQRLEHLDHTLTALVSQFTARTAVVRDGARAYLANHGRATAELVTAYEARLALERQCQARLQDARSRMLKSLGEVDAAARQTRSRLEAKTDQ